MAYTFTTLNDPSAGTNGGEGTSANGINNAGQIVGAYIDSINKTHGFLYSGGNYTTLNDPSAPNATTATSIDNVGDIVGFFTGNNGNDLGFRYSISSGTYQT